MRFPDDFKKVVNSNCTEYISEGLVIVENNGEFCSFSHMANPKMLKNVEEINEYLQECEVYIKSMDKIIPIKKQLDEWTDEERKELFDNYCTYCGSTDIYCTCMREE